MRNFFISALALTVALTAGSSAYAQTASSGSSSVATLNSSNGKPFGRLVEAVRANPNDMNARRSLASALIKKGLTVKAAEQIKLVMSVCGQNPEDLTLLGDASRYSGQFQDAINSYRAALRLAPMSAKALSGLALAYGASGDLQSAFQTCRTASSQVADAAGKAELAKTLASLRSMQATTVASVSSSY